MAGAVVNWSFVLRIIFTSIWKICAPNPATLHSLDRYQPYKKKTRRQLICFGNLKGGWHFFDKISENILGQDLDFWNLNLRWELEKLLKSNWNLKAHRKIGPLTYGKKESKISWNENRDFDSWDFNNPQQIIGLRKHPLTVKQKQIG